VYRRSLYVTRDMAAGELFCADNLRAIRPGLGLAPRHAESLMGRRARQDLKRGTPLDWSLVE
jgi:sialic acid synthase SpsE